MDLTKLKTWIIGVLLLSSALSVCIIFIYENDKIYEGPTQTVSRNEILFETEDYIVESKIKRNNRVFTQGLFIDAEGSFIESGGLYGESQLHKIMINSPDEDVFKIPLSRQYFAEGACLYNNTIYQLTWREGIIFAYNYTGNGAEIIKNISLPYPIREGWGITNSDQELILSDGSDKLYFLSPDIDKMKINRFVKDADKKIPFFDLNELEFAYGLVFANKWQSNDILVIDPKKGNVLKVINFADLTTLENRLNTKNLNIDVLNGIAYDSKSDSFYITGKLWNHFYKVKLKFKI